MYTASIQEPSRPEVFDEILGQEHVVKIFKTSEWPQASVSHAYLFCGTRGTGKTTTAQITGERL